MTSEEFIKFAKSGNATIQALDVVVSTGQTELKGSGLLEVSRGSFLLKFTCCDGEPPELPSIIHREQFWKVTGKFPSGLGFTCLSVPPPSSWKWRLGESQKTCAFKLESIELEADGFAQLDHLAQQFPNLLFIATSNFPEALDEAFVSRCDLVATVGMPPLDVCEIIIRDTLSALAQKFPKLQHLITKGLMEKVARESHGLDGRRLRKTVLSAFTYDKRTAVDPNRLTAEELLQAFRDAKQNMKPGGKKWQP